MHPSHFHNIVLQKLGNSGPYFSQQITIVLLVSSVLLAQLAELPLPILLLAHLLLELLLQFSVFFAELAAAFEEFFVV